MTISGDEALDAISDRYEVRRLIGRGGMGRVYLVLDRKDGREKALKMLHPEHAAKDWLTARFMREARVTRQLDHPGVVKLFGAYRRNGALFYTMEFVPGKNLRTYLAKSGLLDFGSTAHILCLLARALEYTHQFAIHRDISPENIMVVPDGSIRLIDFGLTRLNNDEERLTLTGTGLGKIQYHAPEQDVDASKVDKRADIYPLGVMLHEMLTGQRPNPEVAISSLKPGIPRACDELLRLTLAEDPEERLPTARAFHDKLLAVYEESHRAAPAKPASTAEIAPVPQQAKLSRQSAFQALWRRMMRLLGRGKRSEM